MRSSNWLYYKLMAVRLAIVVVPLSLIILLLKLVLPTMAREYRHRQFNGAVQELRSEHFHFYGHKFDKFAEVTRLAEDFYQAFYRNYGEIFQLAHFSRKPEIFIFGNRQEFLRYHRRQTWSDLPNNAAYYNPLDNRVIMYWSADNRRTLYHEITHQILDLGSAGGHPEWSPWFNEGLAVYFELSHVNAGRIEPGARNAKILARVRQAAPGGLPHSIPRLLMATNQDFRGSDNDLYYYTSYLLIYFLLHGENGAYHQKFYRYFQQQRHPGPCPAYIFWDTIQVSPNRFSKQFTRFVHTN